MILLKDESVKIMNEFDRKNRSAVMNLLTHRYSIPEYDADDILQDAWVFLMDKLTVGEMPDVPEKLSAYLAKVCSYKAHEYLRKRQFEARTISLDDQSFTPEELTAFESEAQTWEEFLEECSRTEHRRLEMMEHELERLTPRETALLMGYYDTDGSRTSMRELARRMGYSSDRVAITLRSRIIRKMRTGIQQQEGALGNGLSPVAFFIGKIPIFGYWACCELLLPLHPQNKRLFRYEIFPIYCCRYSSLSFQCSPFCSRGGALLRCRTADDSQGRDEFRQSPVSLCQLCAQ